MCIYWNIERFLITNINTDKFLEYLCIISHSYEEKALKTSFELVEEGNTRHIFSKKAKHKEKETDSQERERERERKNNNHFRMVNK